MLICIIGTRRPPTLKCSEGEWIAYSLQYARQVKVSNSIKDYTEKRYPLLPPTRQLAAFGIVELVTDGHIFNLAIVAHEKSRLETRKLWFRFLWCLLLFISEYSQVILFKQLGDREKTVFIVMFRGMLVKSVCVGLDSYCKRLRLIIF